PNSQPAQTKTRQPPEQQQCDIHTLGFGRDQALAPVRRARPEHWVAGPWSCRGVGVPATLSRWRSRVQVPSGPRSSLTGRTAGTSSGSQVPSAYGPKDRTPDYESGSGGSSPP